MQPNKNRRDLLSAVDAGVPPFVQHVVETFGAAGLALGIVRGDELIYAQGFGVRNLETGEEPPSFDEVWSCSKRMHRQQWQQARLVAAADDTDRSAMRNIKQAL